MNSLVMMQVRCNFAVETDDSPGTSSQYFLYWLQLLLSARKRCHPGIKSQPVCGVSLSIYRLAASFSISLAYGAAYAAWRLLDTWCLPQSKASLWAT